MGRLITAGRMAWLLARFGRGRLMQPSTVTWEERHPALFDAVAAALADVPEPRLLSFGCSTGEEVFTLARRFPQGRVRGIDINPVCIATARAQVAERDGDRISFVRAGSAAGEAAEAYDAVFALSVLRHGRLDAERPDDCSAIFPFARFDAALVDLDRCLRPGGVLVLRACHFRFADSSIADRYAVLDSVALDGEVPVYGADNRLLPRQETEEILFRKLNGSSAAR